jgi:DNA-binding MarR family transcriptional regulator
MRHPESDQPQDLLARIHFACRTRQVADPESGGSLSAHQASILDHLEEVSATSLSQLASHMGVTLSTMSLAIRRLVAEGYVRRRRDEDDGRKVCLRLTPAGARIKKAKSTLDPERVASLIDALSAEERGVALRGLALLSQAAQSMPRQIHRESSAEQADPAGLSGKEKNP